MIKVAEAISDMNIGGAGILLLNRLKHSDKRIFDTTVILPKGSLLAERVRKIGIKVLEIDGCADRSLEPGAIIKYYVALSKLKPHILNSHGCLTSRIAAKMTGVPIKIYTRHCVYPVKNIYNCFAVRSLTGSATDFLTDKIIAVAHSAKKNLVQMGISEEKISVIINGAEPLRHMNAEEKANFRKALGIDEDDTVVTICARLEECKDHKCFLRAAKLLRGGKYKFLILGKGSLEKELKEMSHRSGLDNSVIFVGFADDISPYMNITDINVNCSVGTETSSLALSEGMSLGVPAVVSDYGGNPYMIRNGKNGYVYKMGDHRELAELIRKLSEAKHNCEYGRMSNNARRRFEEELNAARMTKNTEGLYLKLYKFKIDPKR